MRDKIVQIIQESGCGFVEKPGTIRTQCPICEREDKFSILKHNGACRCYRGSCEFGKRWFPDWISLTFKIPLRQAKAMLEDEHINVDSLHTEDSLSFTVKEEFDEIEPVPFPEFHMTGILDPACTEGMAYLEKRGITREMAAKYDMQFSKIERRVYFPVKKDDVCYGYQGRHVGNVDESMRMRNNDGFRRDILVMFSDNLIGSDFAILAEGPFDALKFELVGSNVCTMGKVVTDKQMEIIESYGIKKLYLALDDDAAFEMNELVSKTTLQTFKLSVPESCIRRCAGIGKKADFGECTFEEAKEAFDKAEPIDSSKVLFYIPQGVK